MPKLKQKTTRNQIIQKMETYNYRENGNGDFKEGIDCNGRRSS